MRTRKVRKVRIWPLRLIAFLCALSFLFSAFMTGTYAWQNEQEALNNMYGTADVMVPVELVKLEKTADGAEKKKPIANTVFYLYHESGTQIGGRCVTDENGKISILLPAGDYYFEEVSPSIGYTYDTDINGNSVTRYYFAVVEQQETITVKAYNRRLTGNLQIRKTVENTDGAPLSETQQKTAFEFTVTFSDGGTYSYKIDNGEEQTITSGGTLKLCSGQTAVFEKLPVGVLYDVVEMPVEGYIISSTGHRGNIAEETQAVADFINRSEQSKLGSLTVSKEVVGENAALNKEFTFIVTLGDVVEEIKLKHGESKTYVGIPIGTDYIVTEADDSANGYISTVKEYSGQIVDTADVKLPFVNIYDPMPDGKLGSLTVNKTVTGKNADLNKEFTFTVVFEGENAPQNETFTLKANGSKVFENIPYGVTYTVTETDAAEYNPVLNTANGVIAGNHCATVTFINKAPDTSDKTVKLTVQKLLAGELLESDKERLFNMTLTVNGKVTTFTLKADEIKEFDIPLGAVYEVSEENYIGEGFSQSIVNGSGTATEELTEVIVTNTYVGEPRVEIIGEKTWDMNGYDNVVLPESITIQMKNGDTLVEKRIVTPNENGLWQYSFVAPKYNADGSLAVYAVEEEEIRNFRATYEGYNIKNTYVKPIEVDSPIITKVVNGENAPTTVFEFVFTGQHGTPMPEGSVSYRKNLTLNGAGELEIGTITYDKAGTYVYTVHEKNGGADGWTYDTALYTVTVVVTETDCVLSAQTTVDKLGVITDGVVFTNTFEPKKEETVIVSGIKTWEHGDNPEKDRPTSIIVEVYADGELAVQRQVTENDNWQYSFELPRFAQDGHEIVYTIDEADIEDYQKHIDGYDLINTYIGMPDDSDDLDIPNDPTPPSDSPQTGDNSNLGFWFTLMILSLIGLIVTSLMGRKQYAYVGKHSKRPKHGR